MKDITMLFYLAGLAIVIALVVYGVYVNKRKRQSKELLEMFLISLSKSCHEAYWLYGNVAINDDQTHQKITKDINQKIQSDMKHDFDCMFRNLYYFPTSSFKCFTEDQVIKEFMEKIFPKLKDAYLWYKKNNSLLDFVKTKFWEETETIVFEQLRVINKITKK